MFGKLRSRWARDRGKRYSATSYAGALDALMAHRETVHFAIVGANDGRINDPSFDFVRAHPDRTRVLAVEPQVDLHPILRENYGFHPDFTAVQAAVGAGGDLRLFNVRKEFWSAFAPPYAEGWPAYRAPTGITSSDRRHVEAWIRKWSDFAPDDVIGEVVVKCAPLPEILADAGFGDRIDVLQIDAEGTDDIVAYACGIPVLRPQLVFFEIGSLPQDRARRLDEYLGSHGYRVTRLGSNALAQRA